MRAQIVAWHSWRQLNLIQSNPHAAGQSFNQRTLKKKCQPLSEPFIGQLDAVGTLTYSSGGSLNTDESTGTPQSTFNNWSIMPNDTDCGHMHCCRPGMVNGDITIEELPNALGGTFFKATQPIGSLFGSPVHGDLEGIGATKEQALERLKEDRDRLYDGLW
jgi:hypothetical protein